MRLIPLLCRNNTEITVSDGNSNERQQKQTYHVQGLQIRPTEFIVLQNDSFCPFTSLLFRLGPWIYDKRFGFMNARSCSNFNQIQSMHLQTEYFEHNIIRNPTRNPPLGFKCLIYAVAAAINALPYCGCENAIRHDVEIPFM